MRLAGWGDLTTWHPNPRWPTLISALAAGYLAAVVVLRRRLAGRAHHRLATGPGRLVGRHLHRAGVVRDGAVRNTATSDGRRLTTEQHVIIKRHQWERKFYEADRLPTDLPPTDHGSLARGRRTLP